MLSETQKDKLRVCLLCISCEECTLDNRVLCKYPQNHSIRPNMIIYCMQIIMHIYMHIYDFTLYVYDFVYIHTYRYMYMHKQLVFF